MPNFWGFGLKQQGQYYSVNYRIPIKFGIDEADKNNVPFDNADTTTYSIAEIMPSRPNSAGFSNYKISEVIKYSGTTLKGRVLLQITVEKDGTISSKKIARGISAEVDSATLIAFEDPWVGYFWNPAISDGKFVRCRYTIPIDLDVDNNIKCTISADANKEKHSHIDGPAYYILKLPAMVKRMQDSINTKYGVTGSADVSFIVGKDGRLDNIKVTKGFSKNVDYDIISYIKKLWWLWSVSRQDNIPIRVLCNIILKFGK